MRRRTVVKDRLVGYFAKAVADSPKDFRWPMVMARLDTFFGGHSGGDCGPTTQATAPIRPERVDRIRRGRRWRSG